MKLHLRSIWLMGLPDGLPGLRAGKRSVPAASLAAVTTSLLRPGGGSAANAQLRHPPRSPTHIVCTQPRCRHDHAEPPKPRGNPADPLPESDHSFDHSSFPWPLTQTAPTTLIDGKPQPVSWFLRQQLRLLEAGRGLTAIDHLKQWQDAALPAAGGCRRHPLHHSAAGIG